MSDTISFDGELAGHNARVLYEVAGDLPSSAAVAVVSGNTSVPPAINFTDRLRTRAEELADQIELIREYVGSHAAALRHAVESLRSVDELSAADADAMAALIDVSEAATPGSVAGSPAATGSRGDSTAAFRTSGE